ncbi:hypothetical protein LCGC14_1656080 [marine sediment metagenome]|uniref:DUF1353 domain-containing protein n=1 Tax=marine sediment metagenome TaxID=412755 RepID=A0A0F9KVI8_9ZZZZ
MQITYRDLSNWKYQLLGNWYADTEVKGFRIDNIMFTLFESGRLKVRRGYAWDGPSGPTIDTKTFMRASVVHDVLYQCLREGLLPPSYRKLADQELIRYAKLDGMNPVRRFYAYWSLRAFAGGAAKLKTKPMRVHTAP